MLARRWSSPCDAPGWRARRGVGSRTAFLACALLATLARASAEPDSGAAAASRPRLASLLREFAAMPGLSARFRETRRLEILREPLSSSGVLHFAPPDRLVRRVEEPVASTLLVAGDVVAIRGAGGDWNVDLDVHPAVRSFVDGFRLLLRGDLDALEAAYTIEFEASAAAATADWTIRLVPRAEALRRAVASIALAGRGRMVRELRVREANGDETLDEFFEVDADRRFSDAELEGLFRLPKP